MRVLANFSKKVSTGDYENETFTVSVEAETDFNNIEEVANYLFHQAKEAVYRQIGDNPPRIRLHAPTLPGSNIPSDGAEKPAAEATPTPEPAPSGKEPAAKSGENGGKCTQKQMRYIFRLLGDKGIAGEAAEEFLLKTFRTHAVQQASKEQATRLIEELLKEANNSPQAKALAGVR